MYKILIVEDEAIEREMLASLISENFKDYLFVFEAENGIDAIEILKDKNPDFLICDINIPGKNGLEVIDYAKSKKKDILCLVLTSYNYFEYAHEAIQLGVEDFILKPVSVDVMIRSVSNILNKAEKKKTEKTQTTQLVSKMDAIKPIIESDCVHLILNNAKSEQVRELFGILNFLPNTGLCLIFQSEAVPKKKIYEFINEVEDYGYRCIKDSYYDVYVVFVFSLSEITTDDVQILEKVTHKYFDGIDQMGVGDIQRGCEHFYESYLKAIYSFGKPIELSNITVSAEKYKYSLDLDDMCNSILAMFLKFDYKGISNKINQFYLEMLYLDREQLNEIIKKFNSILIETFNQEFESKISLSDQAYIIELDINNPYNNLLDNLTELVEKLTNSVEQETSKSTSILVKKAIAYISLNYMRTITLNDVAEYLEVSPFYVSNLLSTQTGKTFTDLVTEKRIEKSKELLKSDIQIKEIASKTGFGSHNYFTKVFKKVTGLTPKEYKAKFE